MKLELKHLAPYLPYDIQFDNGNGLICTAVGYNQKWYNEKGNVYVIGRCLIKNKKYPDNVFRDAFEISTIKLLLRPRLDLAKEIEHNGKKVVPYGYFTYENEKDLKEGYVDFDMSYNIIEKLFEWHFDLFGLIEKRLAIDINKLKPQGGD